jgi:hypothetical protein
MRIPYNWLLPLVAMGLVFSQSDANAQGYTTCSANEAVCVVEWETAPGTDVPIVDALLRTIENDENRPADRVYMLKRGGFYWLSERIIFDDFHLHIQGQTAGEAGPEAFVCGSGGNEDCGPAIIQRTGDPHDSMMLQGGGENVNFTLRNVWVMGQTTGGNQSDYGPIQLNQSNSRIVIDRVIFDRHDWMHVRVEGGGNKIHVTNSKFRNLFGPSQIWEGLGLRFTAGGDSIVIENNTFMNIGFTPVQFDAVPPRYVRFNHNTLVNVGREAWAGLGLPQFYYANNLIVNGFWHGQDYATYSDPEATDPYTGFFQVRAMPSEYGTNIGRRILLANNSYWRDQAFDNWYSTKDPVVRGQPLVNDTTAGYFREFDNMVMRDNHIGANPNLATDMSGLIPQMIAHIDYFYFQGGGTEAPRYYFDPGRAAEPVLSIWPLPENFSYTNSELLTGSTDGLPVGDLNWFPDALAQFEANKAQYVAALEDMAQAEQIEVVGRFEAEDAQLAGGTEIIAADGFTYFQMDGSGFIQWVFDIEESKEYEIDVWTHMRNNNTRGQHFYLNGVSIRDTRNWGEYIWDTGEGPHAGMPTNEWVWTTIRQSELHADYSTALTLPTGQNTIRIQPSWGYQNFAGIRIIDPATDEVVVEMLAPEATSGGVEPHCDFEGYCPSGFQSVGLGTDGSVTFNLEAPHTGDYMLRIFHSGTGSVDVLIDNEATSTVSLDGGVEGGEALTSRLRINAGVRTITLGAASGDVAIDYIQILAIGTGTSSERMTLPEGFALDQNYPNPFNPTTTISFSIGQAGPVSVAVYDVLGRRVATLVSQDLPAGTHRVTWNAVSDAGVPVASGVYLYRMEAGKVQTTRTMVLIK